MTIRFEPIEDASIDRPEVNVPLLRKTVEWATDQWRKAQRGEASEWTQKFYFVKRQRLDCGTACCIAGKVVLDAGYEPAYEDGDVTAWAVGDGEERPAGEIARELLGLSMFQGERLFWEDNSIHDIWRIAEEISGGEIKASEAFL